MIVFVSMRTSDSTTYPEHRDAISRDWSRWFDTNAIVPVLVPNGLDRPERILDEISGSGLLLTGGDDIGDTPRDRTEQRLLARAMECHLPVFGVCRGLQVINVFFGGGFTRRAITGHAATRHDVTVTDDLDGAVSKGRHTVNSYHDDCVRTGELADTLRVFAVSPDGVVEGLYHPELPVTAVQWHPERDNPAASLDKALLCRWFAQCA